MTRRFTRIFLIVLACVSSICLRAQASETLCDSSFQNCRDQLLALIQNETVGIDVAFWFMQDARYEAAIVNRWHAGVPVRILIDPRANPTYPGNDMMIADFQSTDGSNWQTVGTVSIPMGTTVQVGLAVASHNNSALCTSSFDQVVVQ